MIIIDDLLLRFFGISIKPFDMIWLIELLRDYSLKEKYNVRLISGKIKENRLFFELGETAEEDYRKRHESLMEELQEANKILENLSGDVKIQEFG